MTRRAREGDEIDIKVRPKYAAASSNAAHDEKEEGKGRKVLVEIPRVGVGGVGRKNARPSEYVTYGIVFAGYNRAAD